MAETAKTKARWIRLGLYDLWISGKQGIDIGCGRHDTFDGIDTISMENCVHHDKDMCDAHTMELWGSETFDYVWASHVLEHLENPQQAVRRWYDLLKPGGMMMIQVPERDLYEKRRVLPSQWNGDHKTMWLLDENDPPNTFGLRPFLRWILGDKVYMEVRVVDEDYVRNGDGHAAGEYSIEAIIVKP